MSASKKKTTIHESFSEVKDLYDIYRLTNAIQYLDIPFAPTEYDHVFTVVLVGDGGVGKSALARRFTNHSFIANPPRTELNSHERSFILEKKRIKLVIWDTAGYRSNHRIVSSFLRQANYVLIVYDSTDEITLSNCLMWRERVQRILGTSTPMSLVGTKRDLKRADSVPLEDAAELALNWRMCAFETSSVTGDGVVEVFESLTKLLLRPEDV